jgi:hypothetical protein
MSSQDDADDTNEDAADCAGNTYFVNVLVGLRGTAQHAINVGEASGKDVESLRESVMELMETEEALLSIRTMCGLDENTDANNLLDEVTLFALAEGARGQPLVRTVFPFVNFSTISQSKGETTYLYARIAPPSTTGGAPSGGNRKKRTSAADQPPPPLGAAAAVTKRQDQSHQRLNFRTVAYSWCTHRSFWTHQVLALDSFSVCRATRVRRT